MSNFQVTSNDISTIAAQARKAQSEWALLSYGQRAKHIKKIGPYLGRHVDELVETVHKDNGKLKYDILSTEILSAVMSLSYYISNGKKFMRSTGIGLGCILMFNKISRMVYKPFGVIGIITPWNFPLAIPFSEVVMALLAGNAVILKTASNTVNVGRALAAIFEAADLPKGLFNYVEIKGEEAGRAFIDGGVDKIFFTGSAKTGKELAALAAPRLLPLVLELGGADAAVICADANLDKAAKGIIWAGFSSAGQICGGIQRVLVYKSVYEKFLKKLSILVEKLRVGDDLDSDVGPLVNERQKQKFKEQIDACISGGAKIAAKSQGGDLNDQTLFAPALVLTDVKNSMPVMTEEIFGPVVAVIPVDDAACAISIANDSPYGLSGSVWSANHTRAKKIALQINAGSVMINDHLMSYALAETPWGGFGDSGIGRTHGKIGFQEMLKAQVVVDDILPFSKRSLVWQPYSKKLYKGVRAIVSFLSGPSLFNRIAAVPGVMGIFFRYWKK
ncbi:MAG: aldehyde dehydrogenase family protein [Termitinemataceae bacterium]|nr:MAG: aldehyde dehydrogenase family protein [Termitinemataceae bacterium]